MKTLSIQKFNNLPSGFQESILERSQISCAISNAKQFLKYCKDCQKHDDLKEYGKTALLPYYNKLLEVESLANKYRELWSEKFYQTKLACERALNI
jgi:hypothetical protein